MKPYDVLAAGGGRVLTHSCPRRARRSCNQCYKFETQSDMEVASASDLEEASVQGTILAIEYGGPWGESRHWSPSMATTTLPRLPERTCRLFSERREGGAAGNARSAATVAGRARGSADVGAGRGPRGCP